MDIDNRHDCWDCVYYQQEPIKSPDCNNCRWLNITELEQQRVKYRTYANEHFCMFYGKRVIHRAYNHKHDSFIFPCDECEKDGFTNEKKERGVLIMKGLVIKANEIMKLDDLDRIAEGFKRDMERDGFIIIDDRFEVFQVDTGKETE